MQKSTVRGRRLIVFLTIGALGIILAPLLVIGGCMACFGGAALVGTAGVATASKALETPQAAMAAARETLTAPSSQARTWIATARGTLDETTLDQYAAQMPAGIRSALERDGEERRLVWTWPDESRVVAAFRPQTRSGPLVLYRLDAQP